MASGALPPGFPAVEIEGKHYWDGGLVSNTPLMEVLAARRGATRSPSRSICGARRGAADQPTRRAGATKGDPLLEPHP